MDARFDPTGDKASKKRHVHHLARPWATVLLIPFALAIALATTSAGSVAAKNTVRSTSTAAVPTISGRVTSVGAHRFAVVSGAVTTVVDVSSQTKFVEAGVSAPSIKSLSKGSFVDASLIARPKGSKAAAAKRVLVLRPLTAQVIAHDAVRVSFSGTVTSVGSTSFVLANGSSSATVEVNAATLFYTGSVQTGSIANVTVGTSLGVAANVVTTSPDVVAALHVYLTAPPASTTTTTPVTRVSIQGSVTSVGATSFVLQTSTGANTIELNAATMYYTGSVQSGSIANVTVGTSLGVAGNVVSASPSVITALHVYLSA